MNPTFWRQIQGPPLVAPEFFNGMLVKTDSSLTESEFVVDRPSRFIKYEPKDYGWMTYFNMGSWIQVPSKNCYVIEVDSNRKTIVMHPDTWEGVKKEMKRLEKKRTKHPEIPDPTKIKDFIE